MAKVVRAKPLRVKPKAQKQNQDSGKRVQKTIEFKHGFMVGLSNGFREVTWEDMQERIRKALEAEFPGGSFTPVGGLILIDGKACYPHDFDYETMDRKPGTHPPLYTLTKEEQDEVRVLERIDRESKNPNKLARNPTNLLTSRELDRLNAVRRRKSGTGTGVTSSGEPVNVEWSERDVHDETVAEEATKKIIRRLPVSKPEPAKKPAPKKLVRKRA